MWLFYMTTVFFSDSSSGGMPKFADGRDSPEIHSLMSWDSLLKSAMKTSASFMLPGGSTQPPPGLR